MNLRCADGLSGKPIPVVSSSSPPRRTDAISSHSPECTQRIAFFSDPAPASTSGTPSHNGPRRSAAATVISSS